MATVINAITPLARHHLIEESAAYWTDAELQGWTILGIRDLWRDITDLKQEYFLITDNSNVYLPATPVSASAAGVTFLTGVPPSVHKVYQIEPRDLSVNSSNHGLLFKPIKYNDNKFQLARSKAPIDPANDTIYYAIHGEQSPVRAPDIVCAPSVTSQVPISFSYIPSLGNIQATDLNPIPGESDNALIAWTVAFARAKEREDRSPDPAWLAVYATEKQHLLQSLGLRQYQEPQYVPAEFEEYW